MGWFGCDVAEFARARPEAPAVIAPGRTVTWREFAHGILGAAHAWHARGIGPGSVVAMVLRDRPQDLMATFALQRLGAAILTLDPGELGPGGQASLGETLTRRAGATFFLGDPVDPAPPGTVAIDIGAFAPRDRAALPPPPGPERVAFVNRSSGTTLGVPKLACQRHALLAWRRQSLGRHLPVGTGDRYLALISIAFAYGRYSALRHLEAGAAVVLPPPFPSVAALLAFARAAGVTATSVTPLHLHDLARADGPQPALPGVRIHCSTAALSPEEQAAIRRRVSDQLHVGYGSNEVGTTVMAGPEDLDRRPGTIGRPLDGVAAQAIAPDGSPCPPGRIGELRFRHPAFPCAYLDDVAGSTSHFRDGWFHPGDIGTIDADGYLFLKGRVDDVINVAGRKLYPADIEAHLARHPAVAEAAVVGVPAEREGMVAVAVAVLRRPCAPAELLQYCREGLGPAHSPYAVFVTDALPRTPLGKIDRVALARRVDPARRREGSKAR